MLDRQNLLSLMKAAAKADSSAPTAYSFNGQSLSLFIRRQELQL